MTGDAQRLTARIRSEIEDIDRALGRVQGAWQRAQASADDYYLDSVALNLQGVYSGIERIFDLIAQTVDRSRPAGERWHQELLRQMATEISGVRPAVISLVSRDGLEEYRAFRHIVRNVYAFRFDPVRTGQLVDGAGPLYTQLRAELLGFADFLDARAEG